jgi:mono/diheme cytochrome c family protein
VKADLKVVVMGCLAVLLAVPAMAQGSGADVYKANCAMCHGDDGHAATAVGKALNAASFKDPKIVKTPDADLIAIVKKGKGKMPVFGDKLTGAQVKSVIAYIRTLEK